MTFAENIIACLERATDEEYADGMSWYNRAYEFALTLDPNDPWRAAGVISALSPRKEWNLNMRLAIKAFETGIVTGQTSMMNKQAQRIFDGEFALDVLGGDKTRQFATAIAQNGISDIAVIDRHAFDVATATIHTDATRPNIGKAIYRKMAMHYGQAAAEANISVAQIQAITWVTWKRIKGEK